MSQTSNSNPKIQPRPEAPAGKPAAPATRLKIRSKVVTEMIIRTQSNETLLA